MEMPDVKYPIPDELKELTADALDELARRLMDEAAAIMKAETPTGKLLAAELLSGPQCSGKRPTTSCICEEGYICQS